MSSKNRFIKASATLLLALTVFPCFAQTGDSLKIENQLRAFLQSSERIPSTYIEITGAMSQKARKEQGGALESSETGTKFRAVFQPYKEASFWIKCSPLVTRRKITGDPALFGARNIEYSYNGEWGAMKLFSEWALPAPEMGKSPATSRVNQAFIYGEQPELNWIVKMFLGERVMLSRLLVFGWMPLSDALIPGRLHFEVYNKNADGQTLTTVTFSPNGSPETTQAITYDSNTFALLSIVTTQKGTEGTPFISREEWTFSDFHPLVSELPSYPRRIFYQRFDQKSAAEEILVTIENIKIDLDPSESIFSPPFDEGFFVTDTRTGVSFSASTSPSATIEQLSKQIGTLKNSSPE